MIEFKLPSLGADMVAGRLLEWHVAPGDVVKRGDIVVFDGLDSFKAKLRPERWEPIFAVSNEPQLSFKALYAIAGAFSANAPVKLVAGALAKAAATEVRWIKKRFD